MAAKALSQKLKAQTMYVVEERSLAQIAAEMKISKSTLGDWSKQEKWVQRRSERQQGSSQSALNVLIRQRELLITTIGVENQADAEQIDKLHKLTVAIEKIESRQEAVGPMLDIIGRFARFVTANAGAADCEVVRTWIEKFFDEEQRKNG
jgi:hypothetical protein